MADDARWQNGRLVRMAVQTIVTVTVLAVTVVLLEQLYNGVENQQIRFTPIRTPQSAQQSFCSAKRLSSFR